MLRYGHCSTVLYLLAGALIHLTSHVAQKQHSCAGGAGLCSKASRLVPCSGTLAAVLSCMPLPAHFPFTRVILHALRNGTSPWVRWLEHGRILQVS